MATRGSARLPCHSGRVVNCGRLSLVLTVVLAVSVTHSDASAVSYTNNNLNPTSAEGLLLPSQDGYRELLDDGSPAGVARIAQEEATVQPLQESTRKVRRETSRSRSSRRRSVPSVSSQIKTPFYLLAVVGGAVVGIVAALIRSRCSRYLAAKRDAGTRSTKFRRLAAASEALEAVCTDHLNQTGESGRVNMGFDASERPTGVPEGSGVSSVVLDPKKLEGMERGTQETWLQVEALQAREARLGRYITFAKALLVLGFVSFVLFQIFAPLIANQASSDYGNPPQTPSLNYSGSGNYSQQAALATTRSGNYSQQAALATTRQTATDN